MAAYACRRSDRCVRGRGFNSRRLHSRSKSGSPAGSHDDFDRIIFLSVGLEPTPAGDLRQLGGRERGSASLA
jgi:hypothetical protein